MLNWFGKPKPVEAVKSAPVKLSWPSVTVTRGAGRQSACAQTGYLQNVVGFRCVRLIAESAASVPVVNLEAYPGLVRPNPHQSCQTFLEDIYGWLQISGNAYVLRRGNVLDILHPERIKVVCDAHGWPALYEYRVDNKMHQYTPDQVMHIASFNPVDEIYGSSPLQTAMTAVDVHTSAAKWSKALLDNAARPSGAIVYAGENTNLSTEQFDRLVEELEANHQGAANAGRPMLLEGGLDWKPMGFSPSDMEFMQTKNAAARDIALAFGVPPMLLGLPGDNTYSNYQEANRAFTRQTILPLVHKVLSAFSRFLGETSVSLKPDMDQLTALSDERDAYWQRVAKADFLSDAEKRILLGFDKEQE